MAYKGLAELILGLGIGIGGTLAVQSFRATTPQTLQLDNITQKATTSEDSSNEIPKFEICVSNNSITFKDDFAPGMKAFLYEFNEKNMTNLAFELPLNQIELRRIGARRDYAQFAFPINEHDILPTLKVAHFVRNPRFARSGVSSYDFIQRPETQSYLYAGCS